MPQTHETVLEIDLSALEQNYRFLRSNIPKETKFMAVVKAFGYGSHVFSITKKLETLGVDYFAVAYTSEGVALRDAGITTPILVLHPQSINFETLIERCLEPSIYSQFVLREFIKTTEKLGQKDYPVHIKFNTGLNRLGFTIDELDVIYNQLNDTNSIKVKSLFSHLADSEDWKEREFTLEQIYLFRRIAADFFENQKQEPWVHICNTSGIINYPEATFDMVRSGIGLYGYSNSTELDSQLKPVATLKSIISQIHHLKKGESVGYNRIFKAEKPTTTATIPIGHADGIGRQYGQGKGVFFINGKPAKIIGNVCMDMLMLDITDIECEEGDEVIIFGKDAPATLISEGAGTISYELITGISQRVKRVVIE
ncbi:MAG TPA: alanine racemase [Salinimicrobium sp.]|nr:alanine racemase [Salinimicrobium sp.]